MSELEMSSQDQQVLAMVNQAAAIARAREAAIARKQQEAMPWKRKVLQRLGCAGRVGVSAIFLAGAAEGLMDPVFAAALSAACAVWAAVWYRWGGSHG